MAAWNAMEYAFDGLTVDNISTSIRLVESSSLVNTAELIQKIEDLEQILKPYESISMLFLLHINADKALKDITNYLEHNSNIISKWCKEALANNIENWEAKFYESIFCVENYKLLKSFDILAVNAVHKYNHVYKIPNIRIALYKMCENLIGNELISFLKYMGEKDVSFINHLEVYILKWISEGKISIDKQINLQPILNALKYINRDDLTNQIIYFISNKMLIKNEACYRIIDEKSVGFCFIVNQEIFDKNPKCNRPLADRIGTQIDCDRLQKVFKDFNFHIEIKNNVPSNGILNAIHKNVKSYFKPNHSVFVLIILSHGHKGVIYGVDCNPVQIASIDKCLQLPVLQGKPKVLIIQACQGDAHNKASNSIETDGGFIATDWPCDTIFCMATMPYFVSYRHREKGTWYIQKLCDILEKFPDENILKILTKVNNVVCNSPIFNTEETYRLQPEFISRLQKMLYFKIVSNK